MTQPKFAAQRDLNEPGIVLALTAVGATVVQLNSPKILGVPDLLVGREDPRTGIRTTYLIEVKSGTRGFSKDQEDFVGWWKGAPVHLVRNNHQGLVVVGAASAIAGLDCRP